MRNAIKALGKCAVYISAIVLGWLVLLIVLDVFLRNTFLVFIPGVFELTQVFLSVIVFLAIAYANDNKKHVVVDFLYNAMPRAGKLTFLIISSIFVLFIAAASGWFMLQFSLMQMSMVVHTPMLRVLLWPFSMVAALGMLLFCLSAIGQLVYTIKDREVLSLDTN